MCQSLQENQHLVTEFSNANKNTVKFTNKIIFTSKNGVGKYLEIENTYLSRNLSMRKINNDDKIFIC